MGITDRVKSAWNAFLNKKENQTTYYPPEGPSSFSNPQYRAWRYSKGSILDTIVNRIAIDVSMVSFEHIRLDGDPATEDVVDDGINQCLNLEANIDQSNIEFIQDLVTCIMDDGVAAVVPVDVDVDPWRHDGFDILTIRTGKIVEWYPRHVRINLYNDRNGEREDVIVAKEKCAIITNPIYEVVNGNNSTLKRLSKKLSLMDVIDNGNSQAKMDLILQLPYTIKTDVRRAEAENRIKQIEQQLLNSKYGIAYVDATEKITQLNRAVENNLLKEIEYLTTELYNQLGLTSAVFNGTASEAELKSYYDRTINPIAKRIATEFTRKFISKNARTRGHRIVYHTDLFSLVPMEQLASSLDTLRRNVIITTNEARKIIGYKPSDDPNANTLSNPNIADVNQNTDPSAMLNEMLTGDYEEDEEEEDQDV